MNHANNMFLNCAVMTVSDTRTPDDDSSGDYLVDALSREGHRCVDRDIVKDNIYEIRRIFSEWIADSRIQVIISNGGTGFSLGNSLPEAVRPLLDKEITGFGEIFRQLSYGEVGSATIQSRALAGYANGKLLFCLPGATKSCMTAWEGIIRDQLDCTYLPGNFATHLASTGG